MSANGRTSTQEVADYAIQWGAAHARGQVTLDDVKAAFTPERTYIPPSSTDVRA